MRQLQLQNAQLQLLVAKLHLESFDKDETIRKLSSELDYLRGAQFGKSYQKLVQEHKTYVQPEETPTIQEKHKAEVISSQTSDGHGEGYQVSKPVPRGLTIGSWHVSAQEFEDMTFVDKVTFLNFYRDSSIDNLSLSDICTALGRPNLNYVFYGKIQQNQKASPEIVTRICQVKKELQEYWQKRRESKETTTLDNIYVDPKTGLVEKREASL